MKNLVFLILIITLSFSADAQSYNIFQTIDALRKSAAPKDGSVAYVLGYYHKGDGGGGLYYYSDTAKAPDDGGGIIKVNGASGAYIHEVRNGIVNLKWWGIRPLTNTGTVYNLKQDDIAEEFNAAIHFIQTRAQGSALVIDAGTGGVWGGGHYYCSQTWLLDKPNIFVTGTRSSIGKPTTRIIWDARDLCINVPEKAKSVTLEHLEISQLNDGFKWGDSSGHGIYSRAQVFADNLSFLNLAGDGIRIEACAIPNNPVYGNADHSVLKNIWANYTNNGIYIKGCDANKITIEKLQVSNVRRWGTWDMSFLGNDYREPHWAYCGFAGNGNPTAVNYNGVRYITRWSVPDTYVNLDKRPDLFPDIWIVIGDDIYTEPWVNNKRYWSGGSYAMMDDNAWHMIMSPYTETAQAPGFVNTRTKLENGTRGAATYGGAQSYIVFGTEYHSANNVMPGLLLKRGDFKSTTEYPVNPLHVISQPSKSGSLANTVFQSLDPAIWLQLTTTGGTGYVSMDEKGYMRLFPKVGAGLAVGLNSLHSTNGLLSLGTNDSRFTNLYVANTGAAAVSGTATLSGGTVTVNTTQAFTGSNIFLTVKTPSGTRGFLSYTVVNGSSFVIQSSSKTDSSSVSWFIVN